MKVMSKYTVLFLCFSFFGLAFFAAQNLEAQQREIVRLYDITGNDFALTIHGQSTVHPIQAIRRGRVILERSGIVHTGAGTSIDILLIPSRTLIRMAENTSLIYNGLNAAGNFEDFGLLYGRIRIIAENRTRPIVVRGGRALTRITNGDFGIDHLVEADEWSYASQPQLRLNAFQGRAEYFSNVTVNQTFFSASQSSIVGEGESITTMGRGPLDEDTQAYWGLNMPNGLGSEPRVIFSLLPHDSPTINRGKNISLAMGLFITAASVATLVISYPQFDIIKNRDLAQNINNAAYIPLGMGLATTLGGILYNPSRP